MRHHEQCRYDVMIILVLIDIAVRCEIASEVLGRNLDQNEPGRYYYLFDASG